MTRLEQYLNTFKIDKIASRSSYWSSSHQIHDSTLPWLWALPWAIRLVDECRVGTMIRQNLIHILNNLEGFTRKESVKINSPVPISITYNCIYPIYKLLLAIGGYQRITVQRTYRWHCLCKIGRLFQGDALFWEGLGEVVGGHDKLAVLALRFGGLKKHNSTNVYDVKMDEPIFPSQNV